MCIVIDSCTLAAVFDERNGHHRDFAPILHWIYKGKGKIIYGGSHYVQELANAPNYLKIFNELGKIKKAIKINDGEVDKAESEIKDAANNKGFDDPHIVAILRVSRCGVVCTCDGKAIPFLKDKSLYGRKLKRPRIYSGKKNKNLLQDTCDKECVH